MSVKENKRRCFKCGCSPAADNITLFRFPNPGVKNIFRCELWAKYIFPEKEYSSLAFQNKLYSEHRMLCERHFKDSDFADESTKKKLVRNAVPSDTEHQTPILPVHPPSVLPMVAYSSPATTKNKYETPFQSEFSWQQPSAVVSVTEEIETAMEADLYDVGDNTMTHVALHKTERDGGTATGHEGYRCNECDGEIHGFRYTCVQCADYDLCSACEARGAHARHYVLRVPGPRPHGELQAVLRTIRRALLSDSIVHVAGAHHDALVEVKEEPEDPIRLDEVPPGDVICTRRPSNPQLTDKSNDLKKSGDGVTESEDDSTESDDDDTESDDEEQIEDNVKVHQTTAKQMTVPDTCLLKQLHRLSKVPESRPRKRTVQAAQSMYYIDLKSNTSLTQPVQKRLHGTVALPEHIKEK